MATTRDSVTRIGRASAPERNASSLGISSGLASGWDGCKWRLQTAISWLGAGSTRRLMTVPDLKSWSADIDAAWITKRWHLRAIIALMVVFFAASLFSPSLRRPILGASYSRSNTRMFGLLRPTGDTV